jgi:inner membrane protein
MPSLGHVVVGVAAGKLHAGADGPRARATLALTALATFPDVDILARRLGALRDSAWLHRGASHSLLVAAVAGIAAAVIMGGLGRSRWRMAVTGVLVAASHGILDAFTSGGAGIMLLWPLTEARFLAPWDFTPRWDVLPAAPMLLHVLSPRGVGVLAREAVVFSPLILYALWPRRRPVATGPPVRAR